MSFNYNRFKQKADGDSLWTSYSDLFMGLSFVFLLLYVVASLRVSTGGFEAHSKIQQLTQENNDLKNQLKIYESIKNQHLAERANDEEKKMYEQLMAHLDLLKDETRSKNQELKQEIAANVKEEQALNQYQQMVRNVINKNLVAKTQILRRNEVIGEQDVKIEKSAEEISQLKQTVDQNETQIARNERQIQLANDKLAENIARLKESYEQKEITEKNYQQMIGSLKSNTNAQISKLKQKTKDHQLKIAQASRELQQTQAQLQQVSSQKSQLEDDLKNREAEFQRQVASLRSQHAKRRKSDFAKFQQQLEQEQLGAAERAAKEAEFRAKTAAQERELAGKIRGLKNKIGDISGQLAQAKAEIEARKAVAKDIKKGFAAAGIKAEVDAETGDVTIDFGDNYFETGNAALKPAMEKILKKALPVYSKALLGNQKTAEKISGLEIVGFASPTYQGRVIDPKSLDPRDQKAAEYNLDLSYMRAKSIYQYIYDPSSLEFEHQVKLRSLTKVSGKSFFDANKVDRGLASLGAKEFCKRVNCKSSQKVMIRFSVDRKK